MVKYENHCCGCATDNYPCLGSSCPNRRVKIYYCDKCKRVIEDFYEDIYEVDGEDLCEECLKKELRR